MFIDTVPEERAADRLAAYYQQQRSVWGFLPNYAAAFSTRPDVAEAWNLLNATVRDGMDRRRFEIATIAAARALRSTYCTAAHSMFLRDVCGDEPTMVVLAGDPDGAAWRSRTARSTASRRRWPVTPPRSARTTSTNSAP